MKYKVVVRKVIVKECAVEVEANSAVDAMNKSLEYEGPGRFAASNYKESDWAVVEVNIVLSKRLEAYLELERIMIALDDKGDETAADSIRDKLDPIWYAMSDEEKELLNRRLGMR